METSTVADWSRNAGPGISFLRKSLPFLATEEEEAPLVRRKRKPVSALPPLVRYEAANLPSLSKKAKPEADYLVTAGATAPIQSTTGFYYYPAPVEALGVPVTGALAVRSRRPTASVPRRARLSRTPSRTTTKRKRGARKTNIKTRLVADLKRQRKALEKKIKDIDADLRSLGAKRSKRRKT